MSDALEHHPAAHHQLHRPAELPRGGRRERRLGPGPQLAAEARAQEFRDDPDVVLRHAQHLCEHVAVVDHPLRGLVQRER